MAGTLLEAKFAYTTVSWLPLVRFSWKFVRRSSQAHTIDGAILVAMRKEWWTLSLECEVHIRLYPSFNWKDFPENSCLALSTHTLQHLQVWIGLVINSDHFTWRAVCLLRCISTSSGGIFWKFLTLTLYSCLTNGKSLVSIGQYSRALYLKSIVLSEIYLGFHWRDFPENSYHALSTHSQHMWMFGSYRSIIKSTSLSRAVLFSAVSRIPFEGFPWKFKPCTFHTCVTNSASLVAIGQ